MKQDVLAVAVGYSFGMFPAKELEGIHLDRVGAVRYEGDNFNLFKAASFEESQKVDVLLDKYGEYRIQDYKIEPVIMQGEIEMVIPGFDKDRDSLMFGGYSFICNEKEIPVDFSGISWNVRQEGDRVNIDFVTGRTPLATDHYLDDCYEEDYRAAGLRIQDITAEFLSRTTCISEFFVSLEMNGNEYSTEDIARNGRFAIKSLSFENDSKEFAVKQDVLDTFNLSMERVGVKSLEEQILVANKEAVSQVTDKTPIFLFEENRSGERMGKPGDANNVYYASWFRFYSFGPDLTPRSEGLSLDFKDPTTHKTVPGGNGISEVDVIEAFRKANPSRSVVMLSIEPFKGNLEVKMNQAILKFKEEGKALLVLPPLDSPAKQAETTR